MEVPVVTAERNHELGAFLRTRRARIEPEHVGLLAEGHRRVPGLRREELARLAGVSPDYYTRLEQGRQPTASPSVLDRLARALRLSTEERLHLYVLAGAGMPVDAAPPSSAGSVDYRVRRVFDLVEGTPALVRGPFLDLIEVNEALRFLYPDLCDLPARERNGVRWMLLSSTARELYGGQWETAVRDFTGMLRLDVGRLPSSPRAREIVEELTAASPLFRRLWKEHQVSGWTAEAKVLHHPVAGPLTFFNHAISVAGVPDQQIYLLIPEDRPAFSAALRQARTTA
ncbi:MAG TPA: helix-turn-helix transcriptional regulator [Trebonia sp.]